MDSRTVITLGIILFVVVGAFAFVLLNPDARKAMQTNTSESINQAAKESGLDTKQKPKE